MRLWKGKIFYCYICKAEIQLQVPQKHAVVAAATTSKAALKAVVLQCLGKLTSCVRKRNGEWVSSRSRAHPGPPAHTASALPSNFQSSPVWFKGTVAVFCIMDCSPDWGQPCLHQGKVCFRGCIVSTHLKIRKTDSGCTKVCSIVVRLPACPMSSRTQHNSYSGIVKIAAICMLLIALPFVAQEGKVAF